LSQTCIINQANKIIQIISNTYECTEAPVLSLAVDGAVVVVVVVVEASIAEVNSSTCLDVLTSVIWVNSLALC
jgi:hypothetical protein